jgi:hypothetical protein
MFKLFLFIFFIYFKMITQLRYHHHRYGSSPEHLNDTVRNSCIEHNFVSISIYINIYNQ